VIESDDLGTGRDAACNFGDQVVVTSDVSDQKSTSVAMNHRRSSGQNRSGSRHATNDPGSCIWVAAETGPARSEVVGAVRQVEAWNLLQYDAYGGIAAFVLNAQSQPFLVERLDEGTSVRDGGRRVVEAVASRLDVVVADHRYRLARTG